MHLHCALGAELLTAEAANTAFSIDNRFFILNNNRLRGADIAANSAAYAEAFFKHGSRFQYRSRDFREESFYGALTVARKGERTALNNSLKVGKAESLGASDNLQLLGKVWCHTAKIRGV